MEYFLYGFRMIGILAINYAINELIEIRAMKKFIIKHIEEDQKPNISVNINFKELYSNPLIIIILGVIVIISTLLKK